MKKKTEKPKEPTKPDKAKKKEEEVEQDRFDFGGLPKRDLKKNLGCG